MAVQVSVVEEAIKAVAKEAAFVVDEDYINYNLSQWASYTSAQKLNEETVDKYTGIINSPSISIFAPQVIRFPDCEYTSPLIKTIKYSRRNIYQRDEYTCQYCQNKRPELKKALLGQPKSTLKSFLNLDHVIPRAKGGKSSWENIVTSCIWCNRDKGDKLLSEMGWKLNRKPLRPKWQSHTETPFKSAKREYWERFLSQ